MPLKSTPLIVVSTPHAVDVAVVEQFDRFDKRAASRHFAAIREVRDVVRTRR